MRVAINGFGRIGRSVFRILSRRDDIEVAVINDIASDEGLAYLLKYDTIMGTYAGEVVLKDHRLSAGTQSALMTAIPRLEELPWKRERVDVVIEATGRFRTRGELQGHLDAGAKKVLLTVPAKDEIDCTVVLGVNDDALKPQHQVVSNASCTTNCLAPVAKVLHRRFGIARGLMTTVHAYTNDQRLADVPHRDLRRSRAAAENIIPTTTGAARAVGKVLPELNGRLDGMAMRVPVPDGSVVDLVAMLETETSVDEVHAAMQEAADGDMKGILQYSEEPLVSSDIIGNQHSSIFDAPSTQMGTSRSVRILSWYDNEWGYSNRVVDLINRLA